MKRIRKGIVRRIGLGLAVSVLTWNAGVPVMARAPETADKQNAVPAGGELLPSEAPVGYGEACGPVMSDDGQDQADSPICAVDSKLMFTGNDSLGMLFSDAFAEEAAPQSGQSGQTDSGYRIFSVGMTDKTAAVRLESVRGDSELVVAVYEEDGRKLLASGTSAVKKGDREATVTISTESMPAYYYLRAYLVEPETLAPLSEVFESAEHTRRMQEFLAKTTDDFDAALVVNLDEDSGNNFLVYATDVVQVRETGSVNVLESADDAARRYVLRNADDAVRGLKKGDKLSCALNGGGYLFVKAETVATDADGRTVITGQEVSPGELFSYIRIDASADTSSVIRREQKQKTAPENSGLTDGTDPEAADLDIVFQNELEFSVNDEYGTIDYPFNETISGDHGEEISIGGSFIIKPTLNLKYYLSTDIFSGDYSFVEAVLHFPMEVNFTFGGRFRAEYPLATIPMASLFGAVTAEITPAVVLEATGEVKGSIRVEAAIGGRYDTDTGFSSLSETPSLTSDIAVQGKVFLGMELAPGIMILSRKVAVIELPLTIGGELAGTLKYPVVGDGETVHECTDCIEGKASLRIEGELRLLVGDRNVFESLLLGNPKFSVRMLDTDWYYSFDYNEFGFGRTCPHYFSKITFTVKNLEGDPVEDARIRVEDGARVLEADGTLSKIYTLYTDRNGQAACYQPDGVYSASVSAMNYKTKEIPEYHVDHEKRKVNVVLSDLYRVVFEVRYYGLRYHDYMNMDPIAGAHIYCSEGFWTREDSSSAKLEELITDGNGLAEGYMKHGQYTATVSAAGMQTINKAFSVSKDDYKQSIILGQDSTGSASAAAAGYMLVSGVSDIRILSDARGMGDENGTVYDPGRIYNIYTLRSREAVSPLSSDNLLYIIQRRSDDEGRLDLTVYPGQEVPGAVTLAVGMKESHEEEIPDPDVDPGEVLPEDIPAGGIASIPTDALWIAGLRDLTYDGTNQTQEFRLYDGKKLLTEKTDYTVSYRNNKNAFTYDDADGLTEEDRRKAPQLILRMRGNYTGTERILFRILSAGEEGETSAPRISMKKAVVTPIPVQYYTGRSYTVDDLKGTDGRTPLGFSVSYPGNSAQLTQGVDYEIRILNGRNAGTATLILRGKNAGGRAGANENSFIGEKRVRFKIVPRSLSDTGVTVSGNGQNCTLTAVYAKSGAKPALTVRFDGRLLKEGRDYSLKYSENTGYAGTGDTSAAEGKLTVTGKGNFTGKLPLMFSITRRPFREDAGITVVAMDKAVGRKAGQYQTAVRVYDTGGKLLKAGTDYRRELIYSDAAGQRLTEGSFPQAGDVISVSVTGMGGFAAEAVTASYRILEPGVVNDIAKATFKIKDQSYQADGGVVLTTGEQFAAAEIGKSREKLTFSADGVTGDFCVLPGSYVKNNAKGTASVTLMGIGKYCGTKTVRFKITARKASLYSAK